LSANGQFVEAITGLSVAPDASAIVFADGGGDISILPLSGRREPQRVIQSSSTETMPAFSPDGRWIAFVSSESGRYDVYVQPYPGTGEKYKISVDGGSEPVWSRNGRELFYRVGDQLMSVQIATQPAFSASRPRPLFSRRFAQTIVGADYDVSPDGEHFVMLNPGEQERAATEISVLLNWFEELNQKVPVK
jgi:Tol biopolymer transport system component